MGDLFKDKVVLVTGSGQGVGRAIAVAFADEGAKVVTNNRNPGSTRLVNMSEGEYNALPAEKRKEFDDIYAGVSGDAETTAQAIRARGGEALPVFADISKPEDVKRMIDQTIEAYGTIHILINVAGAFSGGPLTEITEESWDRLHDIKPKGYFNVMKYAIPYMVGQHWGRIINCSSKAFVGDVIKMADYCSCNAAVVGLSQGAACEYYHEGVTVNIFSPFARTRAAYEGGFRAPADNSIPGMRPFPMANAIPDPESVAPFLMYLCLDEASHITGTFFNISGNEISMHQYPLIQKSVKRVGEGYWTVEELAAQAPRSLLRGYSNVLSIQ